MPCIGGPIFLHATTPTMPELIYIILLTGAFCNGLYIATSENMILWPIRYCLNQFFLIDNVPDADPDTLKAFMRPIYSKWYYPILHCPRCMPSIYGTLLTLFFLPFTPELTWQIPFIVLCSCFVSTYFSTLYEV